MLSESCGRPQESLEVKVLNDTQNGLSQLRNEKQAPPPHGSLVPDTAGISQCNPIPSAISQNLIGQIFGTE